MTKQLSIVKYNSPDQLLADASPWNELWRASDAALPTLMAEHVCAWLAQFAPGVPFCTLAVTDGQRLLAGLPLVQARIGGALKFGRFPANPWSVNGDLLVDPSADVAAALDCLVGGMPSLPWRFLWLEPVRLESARWQALAAALARAGRPAESRCRDTIGLVDIEGDWSAYLASRSRNHRKHLRQVARRLEEAGHVELKVRKHLADGELETLMLAGLDVEDRSWKGHSGSSVRRAPGMLDFFLAQARELNRLGQLRLHFLEVAGRPIAFEYALAAKGSLTPAKIAYDPEFSRSSPWQLLSMNLLESLHAERSAGRGAMTLIDYGGPLTDATAKWATRTYPLGRLVVSTGRVGSGAALFGYRAALKLRAKLRPRAPWALPEIHPLPSPSANQPREAEPGEVHV